MPTGAVKDYGRKKPKVMTSESPTLSEGPPGYTTHDILTARYKRIFRALHWSRVVLAFITLALAASVVGCAGAALHQYAASTTRQDWVLPLWPQTIDLRPTRSLLGVGVVLLALSLAYLVIAIVPSIRQVRALNIMSTISSFLSLGLCLFALIFSSIVTSINGNAPVAGSLVAWTCKWRGYQSITPADFTEICQHGSIALDLILALTLLQAIATGLTGAGWWIEFILISRGALPKDSQIELV